MLEIPSSPTPLTPHNPKSTITTLLAHGRSLIQLIDDQLHLHQPDKENRDTSNAMRSHSSGLQLSFKGDIERGVQDMLVLLQSILSHYQQPASQSREQASKQRLGNIEVWRKAKTEIERISNAISKEKGGKGSLERDCKELASVLATLMDECLSKRPEPPHEAESKGFDSSKDSKRSLLTQKIKQAQLQQQQSEQILKTIRMNPKYIIGNLIEQTKTRDRTVPIKAHHLPSQNSQKFSFSQPDCLQLQPQPQPIHHSRSSRILTEMHSLPAPRQKPNKSLNLGCSRCQIY